MSRNSKYEAARKEEGLKKVTLWVRKTEKASFTC